MPSINRNRVLAILDGHEMNTTGWQQMYSFDVSNISLEPIRVMFGMRIQREDIATSGTKNFQVRCRRLNVSAGGYTVIDDISATAYRLLAQEKSAATFIFDDPLTLNPPSAGQTLRYYLELYYATTGSDNAVENKKGMAWEFLTGT